MASVQGVGRWRWRVLGIGAILIVPGAAVMDDAGVRVVAAAYSLIGEFPYSWGGGHGPSPGPSLGTCRGYRGKIKPCPAKKTVGLDCSGLTRWVYKSAYDRDVLGPGNTDAHLKRLRRVAEPRPGDLVFYGKAKRTHHVGIFIGEGKMINAYATGTRVRIDEVNAIKDLLGYYRL